MSLLTPLIISVNTSVLFFSKHLELVTFFQTVKNTQSRSVSCYYLLLWNIRRHSNDKHKHLGHGFKSLHKIAIFKMYLCIFF